MTGPASTEPARSQRPRRPRRAARPQTPAQPERLQTPAQPERLQTPAQPERPQRREPTAQEAKALAHPLRLQIVRLCTLHELTNKQLADRLAADPATVLYHVRLLVDAGLLTPAPVRTGKKGALEKPYRSTGLSWWLDDPIGKARALRPDPGTAAEPESGGTSAGADADAGDAGAGADLRGLMLDSFTEEFRQAGPDSLAGAARFVLHLTTDEATELERRLLDVLDAYVAGDRERRADERTDRADYNGLLMLHRLAED